IAVGAPVTGIPAWSNGILVRAGGCIRDTSAAGRSYYAGMYTEGGQGKAQLTYPSLVEGGVLADWVFQNSASPSSQVGVVRSGSCAPNGIGPAVEIEPAFQVRSGQVLSALGFPQGNLFNFATNW